MKKKIADILNSNRAINLIWFLVPLVATFIQTFYEGGINNYLIYKNVFFHTKNCQNLYAHYPDLYFDRNNYGILFSIFTAPFAYLPDKLAILLYQFIQLFCLHFVIRKLPIPAFKQNVLFAFLLFEAIANCQNLQTNTFIGFVMVGAYVSILNGKEWKAALLTVIGFLIKIYGIVALGLFFFVKNKLKYIAWSLFFLVFCYFLPLLITNLDFLNQTYLDWFQELSSKNGSNTALDNEHQNMSAIGIVMKLLQNNTFSVLLIIVPAFIIQLVPLVRYKLLNNQTFQMKYLASLLLFIILYSTSTETSTHIIGAIGVGIWWLTSEQYKSRNMLLFILFCFLLGTISTTDLVPNYFNVQIVRKYSLKALPYWIVWFICIYQLLFSIKTADHGRQ